jgi:hypothetical protein
VKGVKHCKELVVLLLAVEGIRLKMWRLHQKLFWGEQRISRPQRRLMRLRKRMTTNANGFHDERLPTKDYNEDAIALVKHSMLYKEFLAERDEILRYKWIESEKAGCDIGFERALMHGIIKYRSVWLQNRRR